MKEKLKDLNPVEYRTQVLEADEIICLALFIIFLHQLQGGAIRFDDFFVPIIAVLLYATEIMYTLFMLIYVN